LAADSCATPRQFVGSRNRGAELGAGIDSLLEV
jgi:hypothetical protein